MLDPTTAAHFEIANGAYDAIESGFAASAQIPTVATGGVLNAASFAKDSNGHGAAVAPGSLIQIYGTYPGTTAQGPSNAPWPDGFGDVTVSFNGIPTP